MTQWLGEVAHGSGPAEDGLRLLGGRAVEDGDGRADEHDVFRV